MPIFRARDFRKIFRKNSDSPDLRIYLGQLRHKLEVNPARPRYLLTEMGVGYRLALQNDKDINQLNDDHP